MELRWDNDLESSLGGVPEDVVEHLASLRNPIRISPRLEDRGYRDTKKSLPLMGLILVAEAGTFEENQPPVQPFPAAGDFPLTFRAPRRRRRYLGWVSLGLNRRSPSDLIERSRPGIHGARRLSDSKATNPPSSWISLAASCSYALRTRRRILLKVPRTPVSRNGTGASAPFSRGMLTFDGKARHESKRRNARSLCWNLRLLSYNLSRGRDFSSTSDLCLGRPPSPGHRHCRLSVPAAAILAAFVGEAVCFGLAELLIGFRSAFHGDGAVRLMSPGRIPLVSRDPGH